MSIPFLPFDSFVAGDALLDFGIAGSPTLTSGEVYSTVGGLGLQTFGFVWLQADIWNPIFSPTFLGFSTGWSSSFGFSYSIFKPSFGFGWTSSFGFTFSLWGPTTITGWTNSIF